VKVALDSGQYLKIEVPAREGASASVVIVGDDGREVGRIVFLSGKITQVLAVESIGLVYDENLGVALRRGDRTVQIMPDLTVIQSER
jgi:hypothetical protein